VVNSWDKLIDYCTAQIRSRYSRGVSTSCSSTGKKRADQARAAAALGPFDHTPVYTREVVKRARSSSPLRPLILVCIHHPSGDPTPSKADIAVTKDIVKAAAPRSVSACMIT